MKKSSILLSMLPISLKLAIKAPIFWYAVPLTSFEVGSFKNLKYMSCSSYPFSLIGQTLAISAITSALAFLTLSSVSFVNLSYIENIWLLKYYIDTTLEAFKKFLATACLTSHFSSILRLLISGAI